MRKKPISIETKLVMFSIMSAVLLGSVATAAWTDPTVTAGSTKIKAAHISELRNAAYWSPNYTGGGGDIGYTGGEVGIGTASPAQSLHVVKNIDPSAGEALLRVGNTATNNWSIGEKAAGIEFALQGKVNGAIKTMHTRAGGDHSYEDAGLVFATGSNASTPVLTDRMTITHDGLVGIGTTTPAHGLDVVGTGSFTGTVAGATPTAGTHLTTKAYVDTAVGGVGGDDLGAGGTTTGSLYTTNRNVGYSSSSRIIFNDAYAGFYTDGATPSLLVYSNSLLPWGAGKALGSTTASRRWADVISVNGNFSGTVSVGTPTAAGHATTKAYVDAIDTAKQDRVTGTCAAGSSIRVIAANGTVTCEVDDAGTGGDNLGNHTATTTLNLSNQNIDNVGLLDIQAVSGKGIRFWGSDTYKIHMGNAAEHKYGPVTDYSIKNNMSNSAARGWTWGVEGVVPTVAFSTGGIAQFAGYVRADGGFQVDGTTVINNTGGIIGDQITDGSIDSSEIEDNTLTAADLAVGSVGTSEVANNSLTASDLASNSVAAAEIAAGAVGTSEVANGSLTYTDTNTASIQRRVTGTCAAGQSIRAISATGTVTCEVDDTGSGGDNLGSGGTTTGSLYASNGSSQGFIGQGASNYSRWDSSGTTYYYKSGGWRFSMGNGGFYPYTAGTMDLGSTGKRWNAVNAEAGNFSGTMSMLGAASVGTNLDMTDGDVQNVHELELKDYDDNTGGANNEHRLLARDGAFMFYDGGVVIGQYGNGAIGDLANGRLIVSSRIGVGKTNPGFPVDVSGTIRASSFLYDSDKRLKKNFIGISNAADILDLETYRFDWKDDGRADIGVIAQEVEKIFPEFVSSGEDGFKAVDYARLVVPLLEVTKAQEAKITDLESRLKALEAK